MPGAVSSKFTENEKRKCFQRWAPFTSCAVSRSSVSSALWQNAFFHKRVVTLFNSASKIHISSFTCGAIHLPILFRNEMRSWDFTSGDVCWLWNSKKNIFWGKKNTFLYHMETISSLLRTTRRYSIKRHLHLQMWCDVNINGIYLSRWIVMIAGLVGRSPDHGWRQASRCTKIDSGQWISRNCSWCCAIGVWVDALMVISSHEQLAPCQWMCLCVCVCECVNSRVNFCKWSSWLRLCPNAHGNFFKIAFFPGLRFERNPRTHTDRYCKIILSHAAAYTGCQAMSSRTQRWWYYFWVWGHVGQSEACKKAEKPHYKKWLDNSNGAVPRKSHLCGLTTKFSHLWKIKLIKCKKMQSDVSYNESSEKMDVKSPVRKVQTGTILVASAFCALLL